MINTVYRLSSQFILACLLAFWFTLATANNPLFLQKIYQDPPYFSDTALHETFKNIWQEIISEGASVREGLPDSQARPLYSGIQAHIEKQMTATEFAKSVWIFHTPLISMAAITEDTLKLPPMEFSDLSTRTVWRAHNLREYLSKGGTVVIAYVANRREGQFGRTKAQLAVFEKLKTKHPKQIIEFAISPSYLPNGYFPQEKIGATYFMQTTKGETFEMTNRGVQIQDARDGAHWGIWLQMREMPKAQTTKQIQDIMQFLEQAGLHEAISTHAQQQGLAPDTLFSLLGPYWRTNS